MPRLNSQFLLSEQNRFQDMETKGEIDVTENVIVLLLNEFIKSQTALPKKMKKKKKCKGDLPEIVCKAACRQHVICARHI